MRLAAQGTEVYMQSFGESNVFDDMLAAAGNPQHWSTAQSLVRTCINEVIGTWAGQPSGSRLALYSTAPPAYAVLHGICVRCGGRA